MTSEDPDTVRRRTTTLAEDCPYRREIWWPDYLLYPCELYFRRNGYPQQEIDRIRTEDSHRWGNRKWSGDRFPKAVAREIYGMFLKPDGTFDYDSFMTNERGYTKFRSATPSSVTYYLNKIFEGQFDSFVVPKLAEDAFWRPFAKLLMGDRLTDDAKHWYKRSKNIAKRVTKIVRYFYDHDIIRNIWFAKTFQTTEGMAHLLDGIREFNYGHKGWGTWAVHVPLLIASLNAAEIETLAASCFDMADYGGKLHFYPLAHFLPMEEQKVADFEALIRARPDVKVSPELKRHVLECIDYSYATYPKKVDAKMSELYERLRNALSPWSGIRREWIRTVHEAAVREAARDRFPVD